MKECLQTHSEDNTTQIPKPKTLQKKKKIKIKERERKLEADNPDECECKNSQQKNRKPNSIKHLKDYTP